MRRPTAQKKRVFDHENAICAELRTRFRLSALYEPRIALTGKRCAELRNCGNYPPVLKACELYFSQAIILDKEHPVLTRKDYMGNHEWCFYGWREGAAHVFLGPNNVPDLWHVKKVNPNAMIHLTEKPVELALRAMQYSSRAGENVLDLFGGSGSTLIAAEQTWRRVFLMELDPLYCDVIVQRWETFTGRKAERISARSNAPAVAEASEVKT